jgi:polar amino acid transport system substrate-binding protein
MQLAIASLVLAQAAFPGEGASDARSFTWYFPQLLEGAGITIYLTVLSFVLAVSLGLPIALMRLYGPTPLRWAATAYVEFFRGIPIALLLFFLYFGLPGLSAQFDGFGIGLSLQLSPITAAVIGFGLNYAAYEAEVYRAGIGAVPSGQWEAAASLGMSSGLTFRRIILPQAIRTILPPMTSDLIALFKDTSIVSIITIEELSKRYQILSKDSMKYAEIGLLTLALYLIMSLPLAWLSRYLEKRWGSAV